MKRVAGVCFADRAGAVDRGGKRSLRMDMVRHAGSLARLERTVFLVKGGFYQEKQGAGGERDKGAQQAEGRQKVRGALSVCAQPPRGA